MNEDGQPALHEAEVVEIATLKPHGRNYRAHPDDQLDHIRQSLREHGVYRNVVVARDGTILAGHGVVEAARSIGLDRLPVIRLDVEPDDPEAIRVLTGDNELGRFAEIDDRLLSELLKELRDADENGLLGTGYDDLMLSALVFVTRPSSEIADIDTAAQWIGLPEFDGETGQGIRVVVGFKNERDRDAFLDVLGMPTIHKKTNGTFSFWWPSRPKDLTKNRTFDVE